MCNRIDSITKLLRDMFLWCHASNNTIIRCADTEKCRMCDKCILIDENEDKSIFMFCFETEKLLYEFQFKRNELGGIQQIINITFIGFED